MYLPTYQLHNCSRYLFLLHAGFLLHGITPSVQPLADYIILLYKWYFSACSNGLWQLYDICELIGRDFHVMQTWQGVKGDGEGVPVYYRLIGSTPSRPPAVTVDKPYKPVWGWEGGRPSSFLPYGAPLRPTHILSLAYKSNFIHVRAWDLNTGLETNRFTELFFSASGVQAVTVTAVTSACQVSGSPL
jgi:hypothetical protein